MSGLFEFSLRFHFISTTGLLVILLFKLLWGLPCLKKIQWIGIQFAKREHGNNCVLMKNPLSWGRDPLGIPGSDHLHQYVWQGPIVTTSFPAWRRHIPINKGTLTERGFQGWQPSRASGGSPTQQAGRDPVEQCPRKKSPSCPLSAASPGTTMGST